MAGDWIPRCKGLNRKPEVLQIARATGIDRRIVSDMLMEFWEWVDSETANGSIDGLTVAQLAETVPGTSEVFWLAVVQARWLTVSPSGIKIPNFDRWLGQSAKKRLMDTKRKNNVRNLSASKADKKRRSSAENDAGVSAFETDKNGTTGQERREEKRGEEPPPILEPETTAENPPGDFDMTPAGLAQRFCFVYAGGPRMGKDPFAVGKEFAEWIRSKTVTASAIRDEIDRPGRDKSEASFQMKQRILANKNRAGPAQKTVAEIAKETADLRARAAAEESDRVSLKGAK